MSDSKRQMQKEATRRRIMDTAFRIYGEEGFQAATNRIAREAGLSHGTVFAHFPTVDDLYKALLKQFGREMNMELHRLSEEGKDIREMLETHLAVINRHESFYRRLVMESGLLPREARFTYISIQSTASFHFSKVFQEDEGLAIRQDIPSHIVFNTWLGLVHHYLLNGDLFAPGQRVLEVKGEELTEAFLLLIAQK